MSGPVQEAWRLLGRSQRGPGIIRGRIFFVSLRASEEISPVCVGRNPSYHMTVTAQLLPLDPAIAAMLPTEEPRPSFGCLEAMSALTGCPLETLWAGMANGLIMAGERLIAGYRASERRKRGARHLGLSLGLKHRERETADQRNARSVQAWYGPLGSEAAR